MKAQVINRFGDPSVFEPAELSIPRLQSGHVLIKVYATSVNPIDCKIRSGAVPEVSPAFPAILHGDVAGVITDVADDVSDFKIGDEVFAYAGGVKGNGGALAEYMVVDKKLLAKKPTTLSLHDTAALPVIAITAWNALFKRANLKSNQSILIHGGVGGVGHIAVQLAKFIGAKVYTTVVKENDIGLAKSLGADEVINAKQEEVHQYISRLTNNQGFDVVFDTVGGPNLQASFKAAAQNGIVVTTAARSTQDLSEMHNKALSLHAVFVLLPLLSHINQEIHAQALTEVTNIIDKGKFRLLIDPHKFTLNQAGEAHALMESGAAQGKVLITVA